MEQDRESFISEKEVSKLLRIGRQTLANWRCQQKGPSYVKSRRLVRYAISGVLAYMEARKMEEERLRKAGKIIHLRIHRAWEELDRLEGLNASHREIMDAKITLPKKCETVREFAQHLHNVAKKLEEDEEAGSNDMSMSS